MAWHRVQSWNLRLPGRRKGLDVAKRKGAGTMETRGAPIEEEAVP